MDEGKGSLDVDADDADVIIKSARFKDSRWDGWRRLFAEPL